MRQLDRHAFQNSAGCGGHSDRERRGPNLLLCHGDSSIGAAADVMLNQNLSPGVGGAMAFALQAGKPEMAPHLLETVQSLRMMAAPVATSIERPLGH